MSEVLIESPDVKIVIIRGFKVELYKEHICIYDPYKRLSKKQQEWIAEYIEAEAFMKKPFDVKVFAANNE